MNTFVNVKLRTFSGEPHTNFQPYIFEWVLFQTNFEISWFGGVKICVKLLILWSSRVSGYIIFYTNICTLKHCQKAKTSFSRETWGDCSLVLSRNILSRLLYRFRSFWILSIPIGKNYWPEWGFSRQGFNCRKDCWLSEIIVQILLSGSGQQIGVALDQVYKTKGRLCFKI